MRVVFAGTPPFAVRALAALHEAGHDIALVLTQPDRPAGRGLKLAPSAVAQWAAEQGLAIAKPATLKSEEAVATIRAAGADVMVVAAYGLLLPASVLQVPRKGCINIHASLLPRWRGAAPIQRAILAGDEESGVSIMQMDAGLDTGAVFFQERFRLRDRETGGSLTEALAALGAQAIVAALASLETMTASAQDHAAATHAPKIDRAEARIRWERSSLEIDRQIRAFDPVPGAETTLGGAGLKIWAAQRVDGSGAPGQVLHSRNSRWVVACGSGALELLTVQRAGGRRLAAADFLRGMGVEEGTLLGQKPLASA